MGAAQRVFLFKLRPCPPCPASRPLRLSHQRAILREDTKPEKCLQAKMQRRRELPLEYVPGGGSRSPPRLLGPTRSHEPFTDLGRWKSPAPRCRALRTPRRTVESQHAGMLTWPEVGLTKAGRPQPVDFNTTCSEFSKQRTRQPRGRRSVFLI